MLVFVFAVEVGFEPTNRINDTSFQDWSGQPLRFTLPISFFVSFTEENVLGPALPSPPEFLWVERQFVSKHLFH